MKALQQINFVLVTLLGLAAGIPKILRSPQEVGFFQSVGLESGAVVAFGLLQLAGGLLLLNKRTRLWGAILVAAMFLLSAILLLLAGQTAFGIVSIVPVIMTAVVLRQTVRSDP